MEEPKSEENAVTHPITPFDPVLSVKWTKVQLHPEDIERILTDKLPGYIPFFTQGGANFPGCRLIHIDGFGFIQGLDPEVLVHFQNVYNLYGKSNTVDTVNKFFATFANYYRAHEFADGQGGMYLYYSSILDEQDTQDLQEISMEKNKAMNAKRAARAEAMKAAKEAKEAETKALLELGRMVRDNGGANEMYENLKKTITDLEAENKTLRRKINKRK